MCTRARREGGAADLPVITAAVAAPLHPSVAATSAARPWEKKGSFEFYFPEDETGGLWIS